jgi:hypothetical protein
MSSATVRRYGWHLRIFLQIYAEITYYAPKDNFCKESRANYEALVV